MVVATRCAPLDAVIATVRKAASITGTTNAPIARVGA